MEQNMGGGAYSNNTTNQNYEPESDQSQEKTNKAKDELGDYVDFEEIDEENK